MAYRLSALVFALALAVPGAAAAAEPPPPPTLAGPHPLDGRIWRPGAAQWQTPEALVAEAARARVVILGETHDNPDHHALQAWMVRRLAAAAPRPVVAFEMIDGDEQRRIDDHLARHPGDAAGLGEALEWKSRGWPDWSLYRPIAEAALAAGGAIRAANLPRELSRAISRGQQPAGTDSRLGLDLPLPPDQAEAMAEEIRAAHCGMLPDTAVPAMVRVQRARDAAMAEIVAAEAVRPGSGPVVLIAGSGHARTDRGVPARLQALAPGLGVFTLAFIEGPSDGTDPTAAALDGSGSAPPFDAVWFTRRAEREDPCARMAEHMRKK